MKILCVDDETNVLSGYKRSLRGQFSLDTASSGAHGLALIDSAGPYAVIVADMNMPGMDGIQFLIKVKEKAPDTVRVMLTGNADQQTAMAAVNEGSVFQFLNKPCPPDVLARTLEMGVRQHRLITAERELLENTLNGSVKLLADVLSMTNPGAFGEGKRLRERVRTVAAHMRVDNLWELELAASLSRIGLVTIPPETIRKHRADLTLSGPEVDMFKRVPELGANLIENIPRLENVAEIVRFQDKHFDGGGLPAEPISGSEIPVGARLLKIISDFSKLEATGLRASGALARMRATSGCYDPEILAAVEMCMLSTATDPKKNSDAELRVEVRELMTEDVLLEDVTTTTDGMTIASAGTVVTQMVREKLSNFAQLTGINGPIRIERKQNNTKPVAA